MRVRNRKCQSRAVVSRTGPAIAFGLLAVGCASSDRMVVFEKGATLPAARQVLANVTARDGRQSASAIDAPEAPRTRTEPVEADCYGSVVEVRADVIRCPR